MTRAGLDLPLEGSRMRHCRKSSSSPRPQARATSLALGSALVVVAALTLGAQAARAEVGPGDVAPDFTLQDIHGVSYTLSDLRGQVVLLDLIGYACQPCIDAGPAVEQIWQDFRDTGVFQALALDMWNGREFEVQGYIDQTGTTFPVLRNAGFLQAPSQYGIPFDNYVVVDADGIVRYTSVDEPGASFNEPVLRSTIQAHLPVGVRSDSWSRIKELYR